jgi:hypothetical protein
MYTYESLAPFQLKHELTMVEAGPSKSGKTEFVKQLVQNTHWISPPPEKIVWCYREWQKTYEPLQDSVTFVKNIPSDDEKLVADLSTRHLLIFYHMMDGNVIIHRGLVYAQGAPSKHKCHLHHAESLRSSSPASHHQSECSLAGIV